MAVTHYLRILEEVRGDNEEQRAHSLTSRALEEVFPRKLLDFSSNAPVMYTEQLKCPPDLTVPFEYLSDQSLVIERIPPGKHTHLKERSPNHLCSFSPVTKVK